jgi:hypothetical protein
MILRWIRRAEREAHQHADPLPSHVGREQFTVDARHDLFALPNGCIAFVQIVCAPAEDGALCQRGNAPWGMNNVNGEICPGVGDGLLCRFGQCACRRYRLLGNLFRARAVIAGLRVAPRFTVDGAFAMVCTQMDSVPAL